MRLNVSLPPSPAAQRIDDDASIHDRLLWAIHLSGMDDLLLFLSSSSAEQQWSLHVLEIVSLMFRDQVRPCSSRPLRVCFLQCAQLLWKEWALPEEAGEGAGAASSAQARQQFRVFVGPFRGGVRLRDAAKKQASWF